MAKQLTKKDKDGKPYERPTEIEANIEGTLGLPLEDIQKRLAVTGSAESTFLTTECVVHLVRRAREDGDEGRLGVLHDALMRRVEHILRFKIPDRKGFDAEDARLAVASDLNCLIAAAGNDLDFFECRFNLALRNLYIPKLRGPKRVPSVSLDGHDKPDDRPLTDEDEFEFNNDHAAAIRSLSAREREAYALVEISGCAIDSSDPKKSSAAEQMGISARMVSNHLKSAKAKLAVLLKDYKS